MQERETAKESGGQVGLRERLTWQPYLRAGPAAQYTALRVNDRERALEPADSLAGEGWNEANQYGSHSPPTLRITVREGLARDGLGG